MAKDKLRQPWDPDECNVFWDRNRLLDVVRVRAKADYVSTLHVGRPQDSLKVLPWLYLWARTNVGCVNLAQEHVPFHELAHARLPFGLTGATPTAMPRMSLWFSVKNCILWRSACPPDRHVLVRTMAPFMR